MPKIEHIVVVMMENHSFDDHFGMLGRGDGFKLDSNGRPLDANPMKDGRLLRAFHMPSTCQLDGAPGQNWIASHTSFNNGRNDGFVRASGPVAMGYWDKTDIPFYHGLAYDLSGVDRYFCSVLAQTYPNRRFLIAGTASGVVSTTTDNLDEVPARQRHDPRSPPRRTASHGSDYASDLPGHRGDREEPHHVQGEHLAHRSVLQRRQGRNPAVGQLRRPTLRRRQHRAESEEDPDDVAYGENFVAKVVNAVMQSPNWKNTCSSTPTTSTAGTTTMSRRRMAVKPDNIPPGADEPGITGAYDRSGSAFRPSSCRRSRSRTTCRMWCTTTRRS